MQMEYFPFDEKKFLHGFYEIIFSFQRSNLTLAKFMKKSTNVQMHLMQITKSMPTLRWKIYQSKGNFQESLCSITFPAVHKASSQIKNSQYKDTKICSK